MIDNRSGATALVITSQDTYRPSNLQADCMHRPPTRRKLASELQQALKSESQRAATETDQKWYAARIAATDRQQRQRMPRTLETGAFFTPHLTHRTEPTAKGVTAEYAVLLPGEEKPSIIRQSWNPAADTHAPLQLPQLTGPRMDFVRQLERNGWQFAGKNGDLLVFQREVNYLQAGKKRAALIAGLMAGGVVTLTALLMLGELIVK